MDTITHARNSLVLIQDDTDRQVAEKALESVIQLFTNPPQVDLPELVTECNIDQLMCSLATNLPVLAAISLTLSLKSPQMGEAVSVIALALGRVMGKTPADMAKMSADYIMRS